MEGSLWYVNMWPAFRRLHVNCLFKKRFTVPPNEQNIDHTRVNHNKFMVSEKTAYVGTSNWAGDYFISTSGVGLVIEEHGSGDGQVVVDRLNQIFLRDWNSPYASELQPS